LAFFIKIVIVISEIVAGNCSSANLGILRNGEQGTFKVTDRTNMANEF